MEKSLTYEKFNEIYNEDPIEALNIINEGRKHSEKNLVRGIHRILERKLNDGDTLREFYELLSLETEASPWNLLNTSHSIKEKIDEAKGVYPFTDGRWHVYWPDDAYINIEERLLNDIDISPYVFEKFFRVYSPAAEFQHSQEVTIKYDETDYEANISYDENKGYGLLKWSKEFTGMLQKLFTEYYSPNENRPNSFYYEPRLRAMRRGNYKNINLHFYIDRIFITVSKNSIQGLEVPISVVKMFFRAYDNLRSNDKLQLNFKVENKGFKGFILKQGERYILEWDEKLITLLTQNIDNDEGLELDLVWDNGPAFTWIVKINKISSKQKEMITLQRIEETQEDAKYQALINDKQLKSNKTPEAPQAVPKMYSKVNKNTIKRDPRIAYEALLNANFECEINPSHTTFVSLNTGENFMEAHHLIPMSKQAEFEYSLDVPGNVVSLCPNCHRAIHLADKKIRDSMLETLYKKRKEKLEVFGLYVLLQELLGFYQ